jgi:hypothetical protein
MNSALAGKVPGRFPAGRPGLRYLVQVAVRVILGAIVGAATLAPGTSRAFVSGLAGAAGTSRTGGKIRPPQAAARPEGGSYQCQRPPEHQAKALTETRRPPGLLSPLCFVGPVTGYTSGPPSVPVVEHPD